MTRLAAEVAFGCAISENCTCHGRARQHASIIAAGRDSETRKILVDLAPFYGHPQSVVVRMAKLVVVHDPVVVVVNGKSQAGTLLKPFAEVGIAVLEPSVAELAAAHGEFLDMIDATELVHLDQEPLTAAVRAAQQRPMAGAQAWDERKVQVDQSPLVAATLACWGFRRWEELATPGAWVL